MAEVFEFFAARLPTSALEWVAHLSIGLAGTILITSVLEHVIHRNLMHVKALPAFVYKRVPFLAWILDEHARLHHSVYYKQFDLEPNPEGKHQNICIGFDQTIIMGMAMMPFILLVACVSPVASVIFCIGGLTHNRTWNLVHTQMHMPKSVFWARTPFYRFLAYHHFMHHQSPRNHLNVVLPLADFIFGTTQKPTHGDIREMVRLDYIVPRSQTGKRLQKTLKPRPGYTWPQEEVVQEPQLAA